MGSKSRRAQTRAMREQTAMTREQFEYQKAEHEKQKLVVAQQKQQYMDFEFTNPYADAQNFFAGMENPYEDMTIDMKAVDFQRQQMQQQQANILQSLRGSAGSSGVAGLAQALANQGALQSQQISANIAQQERQNQMAARGVDLQLQQMERQGDAAVQAMVMQGDAMVQSAEAGREATMLASEYGVLTGTGTGMQTAAANQMSAMGMQAQMHGANAQASMNMLGQGISTAVTAGIGYHILASKAFFLCIPKGTKIDGVKNKINIEDVKPGDIVIGYSGNPVKVLQKHEYLEDPTKERFYEIEFNNGSKINTCDMHKISGIPAKDLTKDVASKKIYKGVEYSYDLLTEDDGYRINNIPVNSMILEMAELAVKLNNNK